MKTIREAVDELLETWPPADPEQRRELRALLSAVKPDATSADEAA